MPGEPGLWWVEVCTAEYDQFGHKRCTLQLGHSGKHHAQWEEDTVSDIRNDISRLLSDHSFIPVNRVRRSLPLRVPALRLACVE
ncbi:hypothetical protein PJN38_24290 [Mycobacterium kansasii]